MLYPKNNEVTLSAALFQSPTCEYRGTPFWAWNCDLNRADLEEEIDCMKQMGLGGFHMHTRIGMSTEYLSDEFMQLVRACVEKAKETDMLAWLYDEDKWPSGFAGGLATKNIENRSKGLLFTQNANRLQEVAEGKVNPCPKKCIFIAKYSVKLDEYGYLDSYKKIDESELPEGQAWYAYLETAPDDSWYNNQAYIDSMDKKAVGEFVRLTHERYKKAVGDEFGKRVPAIFTDEPNYSPHRNKDTHDRLAFAFEGRNVCIPFTANFFETYQKQYGMDLMDSLPEIFWELQNGKISKARYHYYDHAAERFASGFCDTIGEWCSKNGILATGHLLLERDLSSQTYAVGECMRSFRKFGMPGIDMLCNGVEFTTAKQAQSATHQYDCPGVLSELYGVTNWDFDFRGHKLHGDWQAALGITVRVHHLYWVSMAGEAKRDYPASIGHQSPWYKEYPYVEDHFSRLNTAMTRGKPVVKIGVIHPIESYWIYNGCGEHTSAVRKELDDRFQEITNWLLYGLTDFDFICESELPNQYKVSDSGFCIGSMKYDTVLVPACKTIRSTTLKALKEFAAKGGKVIFAGEYPRFVDAEPSQEPATFAATCSVADWSYRSVMDAVESDRVIDIRKKDGSRSDNLIYALRKDGDTNWLFISHVEKPKNPDVSRIEDYTIRLKGEYVPTLYDTLTGEITPVGARYGNGMTEISWQCAEYSSLLLSLLPGKTTLSAFSASVIRDFAALPGEQIHTSELCPMADISLSEPNVLVLDMAEYSIDGGPWQLKEEILRIDNITRKQLGIPQRNGGWAQPWVDRDTTPPQHKMKLRFTIESDIEIDDVLLAFETLKYTNILFNGREIEPKANGWFTDKAIQKVALGKLKKGCNELILSIDYGPRVMVEWCYLLGDFGVKVDGRFARVIAPVRNLTFGDWTTQGLPFYAGDVTYHCAVQGGGETILEVPQFRSPLVAVDVDGKRQGVIAIAPYKLSLGNLSEGEHKVDLTAFGNRINAFGTLHNCDNSAIWVGPDSWRTEGASWSYEYRLRPSGVLITPRLYTNK